MSMVVVWRWRNDRREYLVLRAAGFTDDADWAWRPPSGAIEEGETPLQCAIRELAEETGLEVQVTEIADVAYPTFAVEVGCDCEIVLSDEHDKFEWVPATQMVRRARPEIVASGITESLAALGHS